MKRVLVWRLLVWGLWFAMIGAFALAQDEQVVIRLGDYSETASEFEARYEVALHGVAAQQGVAVDDALRAQLEPFKGRFLEQRVVEIVLLEEAKARGLSVDEDEVQAQIDDIVAGLSEGETLESFLPQVGFRDKAQLRSYLHDQLLTNRVVEALRSEVGVDEAAVAAAYDARQAEFATPEQVCARHILVETAERANELRAELEAGADFAVLASEHSTDPGSAAQGGDLGCFGQAMMVAPFGEAAFGAELEQVVGPVETEFGHHLILVYERRDASVAPLEEVRPQLVAQLEGEAFQAKLEDLRAASGVEVFPEVLGLQETSE